jgi:hypothetical protein
MTPTASPMTGYSASVELILVKDAQRVQLAAVGPEDVIAQQPQDLTAGRGELEIIVDGRKTTYPVELPVGAVPFDRQIPIRVIRPAGREPAPLKPLPLPGDPEWFRSLDAMPPIADADSQ